MALTRFVAALSALLVASPAGAGQAGVASWYGSETCRKSKVCRTASGEAFTPQGLTAAHRYLPFGTRLKVTLLSTGRSVVVRVNDRGPYARGRVLDLSQGAAKVIGLTSVGSGQVRFETIP